MIRIMMITKTTTVIHKTTYKNGLLYVSVAIEKPRSITNDIHIICCLILTQSVTIKSYIMKSSVAFCSLSNDKCKLLKQYV